MTTTVIQTIQRDSIISFPMLGNLQLDPPSYITVFGRNIYFYGILIAIGFLLGILVCTRISKRFGIKEDDLYDVFLWLIPLSIVIYFVSRHKKIPLGAMLDVIVFGLLIGQIIGRWGNFMNREAFGAETTAFCRMGLTAPDGTTIYVHPTFLYESLWNLVCLIFLAVFVRRGKRRYDGQCILIYFLWYGIGRAWIEGLRTDSLYIGSTGIRVSQVLSAVLALAALITLIVQSRREHPPEALYVNRVAAAEAAKAEEEAENGSGTESSEQTNNTEQGGN